MNIGKESTLLLRKRLEKLRAQLGRWRLANEYLGERRLLLSRERSSEPCPALPVDAGICNGGVDARPRRRRGSKTEAREATYPALHDIPPKVPHGEEREVDVEVAAVVYLLAIWLVVAGFNSLGGPGARRNGQPIAGTRGNELRVTRKTVEAHVRSILGKLDLPI
jgi:hypothetical protein